MEPFITIYTFSYPHEAAIIQGRLESEGIETFLKDELTVQTYHFYSNAVGGIKLQVREGDVPAALEILKDGGYVVMEEDAQLPHFWKEMEASLKGLIDINWKRTLSITGIIAACCIAIGTIIHYVTKPSLLEVFTSNPWCVTHMVYQGAERYPKTIREESWYSRSSAYHCPEVMDFSLNGNFIIPGFDTEQILGTWKLDNDNVVIATASELGPVLLGKFKIHWDEPYLILSSDSASIFAYSYQHLNK